MQLSGKNFTNMQSDGNIIYKTIFCFTLLVLSCTPMYIIRSSEEIAKLNQEIISLSDSSLQIPKFNGVDTTLIFIYEKPIYFSGTQITPLINEHKIFSNGKYEASFKFKHEKVSTTNYIDDEDIQNFVSGLNQIGFFGLNDDSIKNKKYIEYKGCCLLYYLGGLDRTHWLPRRFTGHPPQYVKIELPYLSYHIYYSDLEYDLNIYPTLQDLQVLKKSVEYIEKFLVEIQDRDFH